MSRLDIRRKRQLEQEGESPRGSKVGPILFFCILAALVLVVVLLNQNHNFLNGISSDGEGSVALTQNTLATYGYSSESANGFVRYQNSILEYDREGVRAYSGDGTMEWEVELNLNAPLVSVAGNYILLADKGGKQIFLLNRDNLILTSRTEDPILNASVIENGDFVTVTDEEYYKSRVTVKNLRDEEKFVWHSGNGYVVDAAISSDGKQLVAATLSAKGKLESGVLFFQLTQSEPFQSYVYSDILINRLEYHRGRNVTAVADDRLIGFSSDGEQAWEYEFGERIVDRIAFAEDGTAVLAFATVTGSQSQICTVNTDGQEVTTMSVDNAGRYLDVCSGKIAFNRGKSIVIWDMDGRELYSITANKDLRGLILFSGASRAVGVSSVTFDILEVK